MKKILSYFPFFHFYELFGNFFYSTWDIKLYIEVTKNYDMVMNKKFFNLIFFVSRFFTYEKSPKIYSYFFPRAKSSHPRACEPARAQTPLNSVQDFWGFCDVIRMECDNPAF